MMSFPNVSMKCAAAAIAFAFCGAAGAQTGFRYKMAAGESLRYRITEHSNATQTLKNGASSATVMSIAAAVELRGMKSHGGDVAFTSAFTRCVAHMSAPAYNAGDTSVSLKPLLRKRTLYVITPYGRILSSKPLETATIEDQLEQLVAQEAGPLQLVPMELGSTPLAGGGTWRVERDDTTHQFGNGVILTRTIFEYTNARTVDTLSHRCIALDYTETIAVSGKFAEPSGGEIDVVGGGSGGGRLYLDAARGVLVLRTRSMTESQTLTPFGSQTPAISSAKNITGITALAE